MKAHGPERLSRLSGEQRQPTRGYGGQKTFFFLFFFIIICPVEPRPLAHPRPRVIVTAHWNGLWSAGLGSAGSTTTKTAK